MKHGSYLLTKEMALKAIHLVLDNIFPRLVADQTVKRPDVSVVVLDPIKIFGSMVANKELVGNSMFQMIPGPCNTHIVFRPHTSVEELILAEVAIGDPKKWEHPFGDIARNKAHETRKYQMPNRLIAEGAPWLLAPCDTPFWGSAYENGLIVATSGVQPWFDQMISEMVLAAIKGFCFHEMRKPGGILDREGKEYCMATEAELKS